MFPHLHHIGVDCVFEELADDFDQGRPFAKALAADLKRKIPTLEEVWITFKRPPMRQGSVYFWTVRKNLFSEGGEIEVY